MVPVRTIWDAPLPDRSLSAIEKAARPRIKRTQVHSRRAETSPSSGTAAGRLDEGGINVKGTRECDSVWNATNRSMGCSGQAVDPADDDTSAAPPRFANLSRLESNAVGR